MLQIRQVLKGGRKLGFEKKISETLKITRSTLVALNDLKLDKLYLVYKCSRKNVFEEKIIAIPASNIFDFDF